MLDDPIEERLLEPDIRSGLFAFNPLVLQDLLALGQKFLVED